MRTTTELGKRLKWAMTKRECDCGLTFAKYIATLPMDDQHYRYFRITIFICECGKFHHFAETSALNWINYEADEAWGQPINQCCEMGD